MDVFWLNFSNWDDVFYFGNAIGENGTLPANPTVAVVDSADFNAVRQSGGGFLNPVGVTNPNDFNRDHFVNAFDSGITRDAAGRPSLQLITPPANAAFAPAAAAPDSPLLEAGNPAEFVDDFASPAPMNELLLQAPLQPENRWVPAASPEPSPADGGPQQAEAAQALGSPIPAAAAAGGMLAGADAVGRAPQAFPAVNSPLPMARQAQAAGSPVGLVADAARQTSLVQLPRLFVLPLLGQGTSSSFNEGSRLRPAWLAIPSGTSTEFILPSNSFHSRWSGPANGLFSFDPLNADLAPYGGTKASTPSGKDSAYFRRRFPSGHSLKAVSQHILAEILATPPPSTSNGAAAPAHAHQSAGS